MITLVFAVALMAAGEPAAAPASGAAAPAPASGKAAKDPNAMVCRKEAVIGSRMKQRTCMTQAQWDARQADDRAELEHAQSTKSLSGN
jgi:hypothetical protein